MEVASVDAITGAYHTFNETCEDPMKAIISSASIPFVFPNTKWEDLNPRVVAMDGGSVWNTNLVSAVQRCREKVDDDSKITIDIVECFGYSIDRTFSSTGNTIDNFIRFKNIKDYYSGMDDILSFMRAFPEVNFRYYIQPSAPLPSLKMLDADNATSTFPMQMQGRLDGENAVKLGEGFFFDKIKEWGETELKQEYNLGAYLQEIVYAEARKLKHERMHQED
jgi:hypothetical protein